MNIDEAIELLQTASEGWPLSESEMYYCALELGIEALKAIRMERQHPGRIKAGFLDGETE